MERGRCCGCVCVGVNAEILESLRSNVIVNDDRSRMGLTILVVDAFVLSLLDATVGLAAVIDVGFLRTWEGSVTELVCGGVDEGQTQLSL